MSYQVHLDIFEGPLDLLLFLIKKEDLSITDIPIAQITGEYLNYLDLMKELNLDVAGEFMVMASTLMQIKTQMLLPSPAEGEEGPDPRSELVSKLLEYQKYKQAGDYLEARAAGGYRDIFYRGTPRFSEEEKSLDLSLFEMLEALKTVLSRLGGRGQELQAEAFPVEERIERILFMLEGRAFLTLQQALGEETQRGGAISCFMALLELIKQQRVFARQEALLGEIRIFKKSSAA